MKKRIGIIAGLFFFIAPILLNAQEYRVSEDSKVIIKGTSSLHDWESEVENVEGKGVFKLSDSNIKEIENLEVIFKVSSIESGKSKMNNLTHEALKEEDHPNIIFKVTEVVSITNNTIKARGQLTMAGKTKTIEVTGQATKSGNKINITGQHSLDMTDYGIEPPTAMFGTIQVGEKVTIDYHLILIK